MTEVNKGYLSGIAIIGAFSWAGLLNTIMSMAHLYAATYYGKDYPDASSEDIYKQYNSYTHNQLYTTIIGVSAGLGVMALLLCYLNRYMSLNTPANDQTETPERRALCTKSNTGIGLTLSFGAGFAFTGLYNLIKNSICYDVPKYYYESKSPTAAEMLKAWKDDTKTDSILDLTFIALFGIIALPLTLAVASKVTFFGGNRSGEDSRLLPTNNFQVINPVLESTDTPRL